MTMTDVDFYFFYFSLRLQLKENDLKQMPYDIIPSEKAVSINKT
jgi:hypothetical protein